VLFLKSALQIFNKNNVPISIQEAYAMFINDKSDLKLENYVVYSFLLRLGYTVVRTKSIENIWYVLNDILRLYLYNLVEL
jgi:hypothetical protein